MSSEKARRWTVWQPADHEEAPEIGPRVTRIWEGPPPAPGEKVEVAEVSALRAEWEEELLQRASAGAESLRRYRLGIGCDEAGREVQGASLPDYLCSGDTIAALGCVRAALAAIKEERDGA